MTVKVALAGATGKIGPFVLEQLLLAGFEVTVLSRQNSTSTNSIPKHHKLKIIKVDWDDVTDLTSALHGINVVVSTLTAAVTSKRQPFVDAAVAAGVCRFIPSEFSADIGNPLNRKLPVFHAKAETEEYLRKVSETNSQFSYTLVYTNVWLDWAIQSGFIINRNENVQVRLYDGGSVPFSTTTRATVGKAVVGVINNLEATKNRAVRVLDAVVTQNQLLAVVEEIDGRVRQVEMISGQESEQYAYDELHRPGGDVWKAMVEFQHRAVLTVEHCPDFSKANDNALLGLSIMTIEQVKEVVKVNL